MPFVLDPEPGWETPRKRQRLTTPSKMARRWWHGDGSSGPETDTNHSQGSSYTSAEQLEEQKGHRTQTSDREELIQCIKRGERPTWVPKPGFQALCAEVSAQHVLQSTKNEEKKEVSNPTQQTDNSLELPRIPISLHSPPIADPIRRPPSALHAGDFREHFLADENQQINEAFHSEGNRVQDLYSSSPPPWTSAIPSPRISRTVSDYATMCTSPVEESRRSRAPSLGSSLSSSFVRRVPTSPLVQATNNPLLDFSPRDSATGDSDRAARRRTMPPNTFAGLQMSPLDVTAGIPGRPMPNIRREATMPYQTHQPRRSLNSFTYRPAVSPHGAHPIRPRRLSHTFDLSPRQRTSMVGSFEESILRGRMSTAPSKPLDFVAEIGVLGKGNCPASLKCPAHVTVPFPAVFYSYPSANEPRTISDDSPSPYVGTIDLEHNLKPLDHCPKRKRRSEINDPETLIAKITGPENTSIGRALARESREKQKKTAPRGPPGGAYRVPEQGQLQIIIKNPNKTAVKLFLVPYNLDGMQPGSRTFIRQRSFSSGPIIDSAVPGQFTGTAIPDPLSEKHILRYLVHLKFCSTSKGRFYLYDNIRVVFANRVPEGKEKLRNEVQLPEPKFSPYYPSLGTSRKENSSNAFTLNSPGSSLAGYDLLNGIGCHQQRSQSFTSSPVPFHLVSKSTFKTTGSRSTSENRGQRESDDLYRLSEVAKVPVSEQSQSPVAGFELPSTSARGSPIPWSPSIGSPVAGRFSPVPDPGDGLLSRKLRQLSQQKLRQGENNGEADVKMGEVESMEQRKGWL